MSMTKSAICVFVAVLVISATAAAVEKVPTGYAGSSACQTCHPEIYEAWTSSKHAGAFKPEQEASRTCNTCHSTGLSSANQVPIEMNVGCEACHGPGEEHISSEGDIKLFNGNSADICGRCHNGNQSGDDITWMAEYSPWKKLSDIKGLKLIPVSPDKTPPFSKEIHPSLTYNMWLASGHAKTPDRTIGINGKKWEGPITCTACHNPHFSGNPSQLVMKAEDLCKSCHLQGAVLKGFGAKGIEETRSLHTAAPCVSCHMTEKNHLMKMLRPDDPALPESRLDSCSACHEIKDRKMRAAQLHDMEAWYNEALEPVQKDLKIVGDKLVENPGILNAGLKSKLADVKDNLSIILNDGSNGVHNLDYALEVMSLAKRDLKEIKKAIQ
jgi:predicted CXXCH cytochrome family protein